MTTDETQYSILIDPAAPESTTLALDAPAEVPLGELCEAVDAVLGKDDDCEFLAITVGGRPIGTTSRSYLRQFDAQESRGDVEQSGMSLPGRPRYSVLRYVCPHADCTQTVMRMYHDEINAPHCAKHAMMMELQE